MKQLIIREEIPYQPEHICPFCGWIMNPYDNSYAHLKDRCYEQNIVAEVTLDEQNKWTFAVDDDNDLWRIQYYMSFDSSYSGAYYFLKPTDYGSANTELKKLYENVKRLALDTQSEGYKLVQWHKGKES